jgi:anaerobic magnesium-protoporphyrin IX monomethyl ester cyclase
MLRKKIVLFYPIATNFKQGPPYALLFLERVVRDLGVDMVIFDEKHNENILDYIEDNKSSIILLGISVMLSNQIINARKIAEYTKKNSKIPVLFGGWFPTAFPEVVLAEDFVDLIIMKQGEIPFRELIVKLLDDTKDFETIKGLGYKNNNILIINESNNWTNVFEFPRIDFNKININNYFENNNMFRYIATQGCNCNCNFCTFSMIKEIRHFTNQPEKIIEDITYLKNNIQGLTHFSFIDDNFFSNRTFVLKVCDLLVKYHTNITWNASAHIKQFLTLYNEDDIKIIKESGCSMIWCGAESGDNKILEKINKNFNRNDVIKILRLLRKNQIAASFNLMVAFPPNPAKDFNKTLKFIMHLLLIDRSLEVAVNFYMPFTKNEYYLEATKLGFSIPKTYAAFEKMLSSGLEMKWIKNNMRRQVAFLGEFYLPVIKRKYPLNTKTVLKSVWNFLFIVFYPIVYLRFIIRFYGLNFDAFLGMKIVNYFKKRNGIKLNNLNNFMVGFDRYMED